MPPVLLIVFNRPETTRRVMDRLREIRPERLYVFADGPRVAKGTAEVVLCDEARRVATAVDWTCVVSTRFLDQNVGCARGVPSGIDFLFEHEEEGIILEDDVLPHPSFFPFCARLLERYRDDARVAQIGGFNFVPDERGSSNEVLVSQLSGIWGWATWRRAWCQTDWNAQMHGPETDAMLKRDFAFAYREHLREAFRRTEAHENEAWDYRWFHGWHVRGQVGLVPRVNLIENIGFTSGTHFNGSKVPSFIARLSVGCAHFPLALPTDLEPDREHDRKAELEMGHSLISYAKQVVRSCLRRIALMLMRKGHVRVR